jgi:hypothetical protein
MKSLIYSSLLHATFTLAIVCASPAQAGEKALPPADIVIPKSVFVDDVNHGKDPFFPNSTRRFDQMPRPAVTNLVAPVNQLLEQVVLKGISGTKEQRLALISSVLNSATVAVGELAELKVGQQTLKLRCLEIRERSVVVEIDGGSQIKEIKLREGV